MDSPAESEIPKPKQRPIIRIGSSSPMISDQDVSRASRFIDELNSLYLESRSSGIEIPRLIALHMANLGGEVSYHKFQSQPNKFHPLHFFTSPNAETNRGNETCESYATNTVGIIRASRGDGKESIVLVTPYNSVNLSQNEALSLGIAYAAFSLLAQVTWLAKDIIWLAADSQYGQYNSVASWLRDYHTPSFDGFGKVDAANCHGSNGIQESNLDMSIETEVSDTFRRAGTMAAALVIKVASTSEDGNQDALNIYAEASNGQMPNLDLINVVSYLAVHGQGLQVKMEKLVSLIDSKWLKFIGEVFESVGKIARSLNPQLKFGISVKDYVEGSATLVSSLYNQALGVPTGSHGAFRDYQVDAVTMEISPKITFNSLGRQTEFLFQGGRLIEGIVRSVNNLLEKFHQSFFLYLLTSSNKFISVGVYMIAFLLLVAPLPVVAASLFSDAIKSDEDKATSSDSNSYKSWRWLYPAKTIFLIHLWGAIVSLLPYFIYKIPDSQPTSNILIWASLSIFILTVLHLFFGPHTCHLQEWALLKSVTVSAAFIGLCLMSVINFATAEIGALLLVPMCLVVKPWRAARKVHSALSLVLVVLGFPGVAFFVLKAAFGVQNGSGLAEFWYWLESLWAWNSATYIYLCMVHLPCWVLCIYILLHPC
uniref:glycosylphosphatidylinositol anchor attachment 1 protein isoform X2 n=1 Tax=Erigeron canadensis TaxID=72917 RepID=UPI001CB91E75|nr:glycosylphosphatidylinositol anchor attachment 1 protein isoform X2 [Erigeron canadensis]